MKYIKFWCMADMELPTVSGVDQAYRVGDNGVWAAEDQFDFPEVAITSNMCIRRPLWFMDMTSEEITTYENYLATVSG